MDGQESTTYPRVKLALFAYGGIEPPTHDSLTRELMYCIEKKVFSSYLCVSESALITKSRSKALTMFHEDTSSGDVMVMIDHDMVWNKGDAIETARLAHETQSVVSVVYSKRAFGKGVTCSNGVKSSKIGVGNNKHELLEMERLATGLMCIPRFVPGALINELGYESEKFKAKMDDAIERRDDRRVIELITLGISDNQPGRDDKESPVWDFFSQTKTTNPRGTWTWYGEDFSFCHRLKEIGIKTYVNTGPAIGHVGPHMYTVPDASQPRGNWPKKNQK
jgi:hypothetical protein